MKPIIKGRRRRTGYMAAFSSAKVGNASAVIVGVESILCFGSSRKGAGTILGPLL